MSGYAQFYEKNDSMLAYMLENRGEEAAPEKVDQEKYFLRSFSISCSCAWDRCRTGFCRKFSFAEP